MRSLVVAEIGSTLETSIALFEVRPVLCVGLFARCSLDEALDLAVGSWRIGSGTAVFELHPLAGETEGAGAVAGAVVGEQSADTDAVRGE